MSLRPKVKRLYLDGISNIQFKDDCIKSSEDEMFNKRLSDVEKHFFCAVYVGWLIGKGIYDESKYDKDEINS